jgi:xanthine dehydrogenase small subunit
MRDHILLYINGIRHSVAGRAAFLTVSRFLRDVLGATGTKIVCEEGDCGACTVLVGRRENGGLRYLPINSCIQFVFQLDLAHIVTVEGLARDGVLSAVQDAMVRCQGAQCGYCTPGFITAMTAMYETRQPIDEGTVRCALTGNLCRCTGYESIIKSALEVDPASVETLNERYPAQALLEDFAAHAAEPVRIDEFFKPATLDDAVAFKAEHPKCVIVQGATDVGVWRTKRGFTAEALLSLQGVEHLGEINIEGDALHVGGRVSLATFENAVRTLVPQLAEIMDRFGSPQIKNAGTLAGNIANASPIADSLPFLYVAGATLELTGKAGTRTVGIREFYRGYKTLDLAPDEIITKIIIPLPRDGELLRLYKVSKRSHLDISSFTAAISLTRTDGHVASARIAYGGVGPVVLRLPKTEEFLGGKPFVRETFAEAGEIARTEIAPISDVRGARDFRLQLAENILQRFYAEAASS